MQKSHELALISFFFFSVFAALQDFAELQDLQTQ